MKKLLLVVALSAMVANAGMFSTVSSMGMDEKKVSSEYKIDTVGFNPRIYEFTPTGNSDYVCVALFSSSDKSSTPVMQCIPKKK